MGFFDNITNWFQGAEEQTEPETNTQELSREESWSLQRFSFDLSNEGFQVPFEALEPHASEILSGELTPEGFVQNMSDEEMFEYGLEQHLENQLAAVAWQSEARCARLEAAAEIDADAACAGED